jgi:hypothetical protein
LVEGEDSGAVGINKIVGNGYGLDLVILIADVAA